MRVALPSLLFFLLANAFADERACTDERPGARYTGPMIDAMAQMESTTTRRVLDAFDRAGISRMALFARLHRKRNGESEVLALKQRFPQRFFMGTPKPFDQHGDLRGY